MDIILEVCDTFAFDYIYSAILPAKPLPYDLIKEGLSNSTLHAATSTWKYTPATSYFSFEPRDVAYMSQWQRDNIFRQFISLFFIVWYV